METDPSFTHSTKIGASAKTGQHINLPLEAESITQRLIAIDLCVSLKIGMMDFTNLAVFSLTAMS
jgi:hypothetical protein